ncbi:hypothetical protein AMS58_04430 [Pseudoalteromonas porphyrae]|uniref:DUF4369 domain-containing protein n=1 Tax=Pseudoalteromonas neustonica TaxID=1840331 RepID=A0ABU9U5U8_9GAMM|nr:MULTISPECIES: hypothetical protein [Pseudoalteromonas]KPH95927.1 hypothetical protein AMS58_04430 [Pseudoalteromonas porphyrae]NNG41441.1 hypothetical protein [Pseudoalteromonas sp. NEC-BIFX-2020_002]
MKKILLLLALFCSSAQAIEFQKYPILLESSSGEHVTIIESRDKSQALIKVVGVNSPIDEVVFLTDLKPHGSIEAYKYTFDGEQRALITKGKSYSCCNYTLYLPNTRQGIYLSELKDKRSTAISEDVYAQYQAQQEQGIQLKLAKFDRDNSIKQSQIALTAATKELNKFCGKNITTTVNWQELDDKILQTYAVGAYCAQIATSLAQQCKKQPEFKTKAQRFGKISCEFADELKLRHTDTLIQFKTAPKAPNQAQFVEAYLRNL